MRTGCCACLATVAFNFDGKDSCVKVFVGVAGVVGVTVFEFFGVVWTGCRVYLAIDSFLLME